MSVSLKRLRERRFEYDSHDGAEIVMRRKLSTWSRHAAWLCKHQWPARVVIVTGEVALAYLAFIFGILLGAGLMG